MPRRRQSRSRSAQDSVDSRSPSARAISSLVPSSPAGPRAGPARTSAPARAGLWGALRRPIRRRSCVGQVAVLEGGVVVAPLLRQSGHGGRRSGDRAEELLQGRHEIARGEPVQVAQAAAPRSPSGTCGTRAEGSSRRTACARRWTRRCGGSFTQPRNDSELTPSSRATSVTVRPDDRTSSIASRLYSSEYRFVHLLPTWHYFLWNPMSQSSGVHDQGEASALRLDQDRRRDPRTPRLIS